MIRILTRVREKLHHVVRQELQLQLTHLKGEVSAIKESLISLKGQLEDAPLVTAGIVSNALETKLTRLRPSGTRPVERPLSYEHALTLLQELNPRLFPIWRSLFEAGAKSYVEERLGSCSHRDHHYARLFGAYVSLFAKGTILDIGCGPHGLPAYLTSQDTKNVYGLEPLPTASDAAFTIRRGFNEFIPWADAQFDTVVSGTSLDHVLSLEKSLQEVCRVLRPSGRYLVWLASVPGAEAFDENAATFNSIDRFHLFHFDRAWIEPRLEKHFEISDVIIAKQVGFDHIFYCLKPRNPHVSGHPSLDHS
jgi:SAM-dependent methyltransferase